MFSLENFDLGHFLIAVIDILIVTYIIYKLIMIVRGTRAVQLLQGIFVIIIVWYVSNFFGLVTLNWLMQNTIRWGFLAIIIIFQPEVRRALEQLGRGGFFSRGKSPGEKDMEKSIDDMVSAVNYMAKRRIGALISFEKKTGLNDYVETGISMNARLTYQLLVNVFIPNTPLHDGAVIIRDNQIAAAACYLPLSESPFISKELGTRHRAAIGISEVTDCLTIVVSEETGGISLTKSGELYRDIDEEMLRSLLNRELLDPSDNDQSSFGNGEGKNMDNLLKNKWFVRILSFIIAIMLYTVVTSEQSPTSSGNQTPTQQPEKMENIALDVHYNDDKFILKGAPEHVTIQLRGPQSLLQKASLTNDHQAYIDLSGKKAGTYTVPVQTKGYPEGLTITRFPPKITVELHKKATASFAVKIKLLNKDDIPKGFVVKDVKTSPEEVKVTAPQDIIQRISFVRGYVNMKGAKETIEKSVPLNIYDVQGNEMSVTTSPESVDVTVVVSEESKKVPLNKQIKGSLPEGYQLQSVKLGREEVEIFGPTAVLQDIDHLTVTIDISDMTTDQTLSIPLDIPEKVKKVTPKKVSAKIDVATIQEKTIQDIPIAVKGLDDGQHVSFIQPEDKQVAVTVSGPEDVVTSLKPEAIDASIDVSELTLGEHTVSVVYATSKEVSLHPKIEKVMINITKTTDM